MTDDRMALVELDTRKNRLRKAGVVLMAQCLHGVPEGSLGADRVTNPLERVNKEIKRRADVIGIFPNDASVIRLVGALMLEQNDEWAVSRRYMTLETIGAVSHNPIVSLPAMAA